MKPSPEMHALAQAHALCQGHLDALHDALTDMRQRALSPSEYEHLSKADRRLLDQFAYRYTRLQDDMGARLMPAVLRALAEDVSAMPALDRFSRLEQLGWLPSADNWNVLRQIRNQQIFQESCDGLSRSALADKYGLSLRQIGNIRRQEHATHR